MPHIDNGYMGLLSFLRRDEEDPEYDSTTPVIESLAPRILYSADAATVAFSSPIEWVGEPEPAWVQEIAPAAQSEQIQTTSSLVVIDKALDDVDSLLLFLAAEQRNGTNIDWLVIDGETDGVDAVATHLKDAGDLYETVHLFSHGSNGQFSLGSTVVRDGTLAEHQENLSSWDIGLTDTADILIYACDVSANEQGKALASQLALMTRADVASSTNVSGHSDYDGDWALENQVGSIQSQSLITPELADEWITALSLEPAGGDVLVPQDTTRDDTFENDSGGSQTASNGTNVVVVWEGQDEIYFRRFLVDGTPLDVSDQLIQNNNSINRTMPTVAMATNGDFVIAWTAEDNQDGDNNGVFAQRFNADGSVKARPSDAYSSTYSNPFEFRVNNETDGKQELPSIAIRSDGSFVIGWSGPRTIVGSTSLAALYALHDVDGTRIQAESIASLGFSDDESVVSVAAHPIDGSMIVAFQQEGSDDRIQLRRVSSTGNDIGSTINLGVSGWDVTNPSIAIADNGTAYIAARAKDGGNENILLWIVATDNSIVNPSPIAATETTAGKVRNPEIAVEGNEMVIIAWDTDQAADKDDIVVRQFNGSGVALTGEILVNGYTTQQQRHPSLAINGTTAIVAWSGEGTADDQDIFFRPLMITQPGVSVTPTGTLTTESGGSIDLSIALDSEPLGLVTLTVTSDNPGEGNPTTASITFDSTNWDTPQLVPVIGQDDVLVDGDIDYSVTVDVSSAADSNYNALADIVISLTNQDDDIPAVNDISPVSDTDAANNELAENSPSGSSVGITAFADDPDPGDAVSYSITGPSAALFAVDALTGEVVTDTAALDYESTAAHAFTIVATSSDGSTSQRSFTVAVLDQNDVVPVINAGQSFLIDENAANGTVVGTPVVTDPDTVGSLQGWTITGGSGVGVFDVSVATGQLTVIDSSALNFETTPSFGLTLTVSDGTNTSAPQTVAINLGDLNEPPQGGDATSTATEDTDYVFGVGDFTFADPDAGDALLGIELQSLPASGSLVLNGSVLDGATPLPTFVLSSALTNGDLVYRPQPDVNGPNVTSFGLRAVDLAGERSIVRTQTIDVSASNDAPVITSYGGVATTSLTVNENSIPAATAAATDVDGDAIEYFLSGADAGRFNIGLNSGDITFAALPDFENPTDSGLNNQYEITVEARDPSAASAFQVVTINVADTNDNVPVVTTGQIFGVAESAPNSTVVGVVNAIDVDTIGSLQNWSITGGSGAAAFAIDPLTGQVTVSNSNALDFESTPTLTLTVTVSDGVASSNAETITINLVNRNESPQGANATTTATEDTDYVFGVVDFAFSDPDAGDTLSGIQIESLPGSGSLVLNNIALSTGSGLPVSVSVAQLTGGALLYRPDTNVNGVAVASFGYRVVDSGGLSSAVVTQSMDILATNDAPFLTSYGGTATATINVPENTLAVGTVSAVDPDGGAIQYLVAGPDAAAFNVNVNTGVVEFRVPPDREAPTDTNTDNDYLVTIEARDPNGASVYQTLTVRVGDQNDVAPIIGAAQSFSVNENASGGTPIGAPVATDPDLIGSLQNWAITGGSGAPALVISATTGLLAVSDPALLDYESTTSLVVTISVSDGVNNSAAQTLTINLIDTNEAPTSANGTSVVPEDTDYVITRGDFVFSDPDAGDTMNSALLTGLPTNGALIFNGTALDSGSALPFMVSSADLASGRLVYRPPGDLFGAGADSFTFRAVDVGGAVSGEYVQSIDLLSVNDDPTVSGSRNINLASGSRVAINSSVLIAADVEDGAGQLIFRLDSEPDNGSLSLDGRMLTVGDTFSQLDIDTGQLSYESNAVESGSDTIVLALTDSDGGMESGITINITAVQEGATVPPTADRTPALTGDDTSSDSDELTDDDEASDEDSDQVKPVAVVSPGAPYEKGGSSTKNVDGTDANGAQIGLDSGTANQESRRGESGRWLPSGHYGNDLTKLAGVFGADSFGTGADGLQDSFERLFSAFSADDFDQMRDFMKNDLSRQFQFDQQVVASSVAVSTGLSIGYAIWLLRSGALLSSILASLPAWRSIDPLPILSSLPGNRQPSDDESLEDLVGEQKSGTTAETTRVQERSLAENAIKNH